MNIIKSIYVRLKSLNYYVLVWFECIVDINLDNNKSVIYLCIYIYIL